MLENYRNLVWLGLTASRPGVIDQLERVEVPWVPEGEAPEVSCPDFETRPETTQLFPELGLSMEVSSHEKFLTGDPYVSPLGEDLQCGAWLERKWSSEGKEPCEYNDYGKVFYGHIRLSEHQKIPSREAYECKQCGKAFHRRSGLRDHQRIHTGEKPYVCTQCGKSFSCKSTLTSHYRLHIGDRPYECSICGKAFHQRSGLIEHQRIHTGEKPYECKECGKAFHQRSGLAEHLKIHPREKPYACTKCGRNPSAASPP
uniref:Zinc finger protein 566-like isoform X2 n=1 Tax=Phascolarctos cinereus TaxID=38626 RepID=A0A6P5L9T9_PHACI|nr:zinc finger protein 566-like isoform X2 [Phascolarctos cinereus]